MGEISQGGYFSQILSLFCHFDSCFQALLALVLLFQLFLWVNHMCRSRENQVFDPSDQVRYLKKKPLNMDDFVFDFDVIDP